VAGSGKHDQFIAEFLEQKRIRSHELVSVLDQLKTHKRFISEWDSSDLDEFIKSLCAISVSSINRYVKLIRDFHRFVCGKENIPCRELYLNHQWEYYIDEEKLLSVTLNKNQYRMLRNRLLITVNDEEYNYRDKVAVELAWEGLTAGEMKRIRKDDILDDGSLVIHLKDRNVLIADKETAHDIKMCQVQDQYVVNQNGFYYFCQLRDTPYLLRSIKSKPGSKEAVSDLELAFRLAVERQGISIPGIDIHALTLEDIRRSGIIHLFRMGYTLSEVRQHIGYKTEADLYWLEEWARKLADI